MVSNGGVRQLISRYQISGAPYKRLGSAARLAEVFALPGDVFLGRDCQGEPAGEPNFGSCLSLFRPLARLLEAKAYFSLCLP
jgi:hypothetical protein